MMTTTEQKQPEIGPTSALKFGPAIVILLLFSIGYFLGIARVPFHPDESTYLFMSSDISTFSQNPELLFWTPDNADDPRMRYRVLDAPLNRYLIEISRTSSRIDGLESDWDWSKSWDQNLSAGAYPPEQLLIAGRMAGAFFFPLTLGLIFLIGKRLGGLTTAYSGLILLGSNALILLHTRRAMAEGVLIFTLLLVVWLSTWKKPSPVLLGVAVGLALCAKHSTAPLALLGLFAFLPDLYGKNRNIANVTRQIFVYLISITITFALLNPFLWRHPLQAGNAFLESRQALVAQQTADLAAVRPDLVAQSIPDRLAVALVQVFYAPPDIADVGNYLQNTNDSETLYFTNPLNNLLRGLTWGSIVMALSLLGIILAVKNLFQKRIESVRPLSIVLLAGLLQSAGLIALVPLPFQRYFLPLLPFVCLTSAYAIEQTANLIRQASTRSLAAGKIN
jgi:hypothetical protein